MVSDALVERFVNSNRLTNTYRNTSHIEIVFIFMILRNKSLMRLLMPILRLCCHILRIFFMIKIVLFLVMILL